MGIDRRELYGGGALAGEPLEATVATAQLAEVRVPLAQARDYVTSVPFVALTVHADNLTGRWWRVNGRWVPPWVVGARVPILPGSGELTVEPVTPAGQLSLVTGTELVLTASSAMLEPSPGVYRSDLAASETELERLGITASTSGGPPSVEQLVAAPAAGRRYVVRELRALVAWDSYNRHVITTVSIGWLDAIASVNALASLPVSYESPRAAAVYDPPIVWPDPSAAGVGDAGVHAIAEQWGYSSPAELTLEVLYSTAFAEGA